MELININNNKIKILKKENICRFYKNIIMKIQ